MKTLLASMLGIALLFSLQTLHAEPIGPSPKKVTPAKVIYTVKWKTNGWVQIFYHAYKADDPKPTPKAILDRVNDAKDLGMGTKIEKTRTTVVFGDDTFRIWAYAKRDNYIEKRFTDRKAAQRYYDRITQLIPRNGKDGPNLRISSTNL